MGAQKLTLGKAGIEALVRIAYPDKRHRDRYRIAYCTDWHGLRGSEWIRELEISGLVNSFSMMDARYSMLDSRKMESEEVLIELK